MNTNVYTHLHTDKVRLKVTLPAFQRMLEMGKQTCLIELKKGGCFGYYTLFSFNSSLNTPNMQLIATCSQSYNVSQDQSTIRIECYLTGLDLILQTDNKLPHQTISNHTKLVTKALNTQADQDSQESALAQSNVESDWELDLILDYQSTLLKSGFVINSVTSSNCCCSKSFKLNNATPVSKSNCVQSNL